jgi:hypothetical protein
MHTLQDFSNNYNTKTKVVCSKVETTPTLKQKTNLRPSEFPDCGFDFSSAGSLFYKTLNGVADTSF